MAATPNALAGSDAVTADLGGTDPNVTAPSPWGNSVPPPPPISASDLAGRVATAANTNAAVNPRPNAPGSWARSLMGGVQDALAGFGAGGKVPEGAGGLYGVGAGARQAQAQKQQKFENQLKQQDMTQKQLIAAATITDTNARTAYQQMLTSTLSYDNRQKALASDKAAADAYFQNGAPVIQQDVDSSELQKLITQGKVNGHKYVALATGQIPIIGADGQPAFDDSGNPLTRPTFTVFDPQNAPDVVLNAQQAKFISDNTQYKLAAGSKMSGTTYRHMTQLGASNVAAQDATDELLAKAEVGKLNAQNDLEAQRAWPQWGTALGKSIGKDEKPDVAVAYGWLLKNNPQAAAVVPRLFTSDKGSGPENFQGVLNNEAETKAKEAETQEKAREFNDLNAPNPANGLTVGQTIAQGLVDHDMDPSQLSKRATKGSDSYNALLAAANNYSMKTKGVPFDIAQASTDYKQAQNPQVQSTLKLLNSVIPNLQEVMSYSAKLPRTQFPAINNAQAWARLQTGNPDITAFHTAVTEVSDQIAKILQGGTGSSTSDAKLKQASDILNTGFTPQQLQANVSTLTDLLGNRQSALIGDNPYLQKQFSKAPPPAAVAIPAGSVSVQIPGQPPGHVPQQNLAAFKAAHPNAIIGVGNGQ